MHQYSLIKLVSMRNSVLASCSCSNTALCTAGNSLAKIAGSCELKQLLNGIMSGTHDQTVDFKHDTQADGWHELGPLSDAATPNAADFAPRSNLPSRSKTASHYVTDTCLTHIKAAGLLCAHMCVQGSLAMTKVDLV